MRVSGKEHVQEFYAAKRPFVFAVWHGRMMAPVWHNRGRGLAAMISESRDGEMVSRLVRRLGYVTIRGSSTRGGTKAALELLGRLRDGWPVAMICDGPRGPIYKMKPGTPYLAIEAGKPVVLAAFAAPSRWILHSWDRFQIPKPFARVYILYSAPILPPASHSDLESFTRTLENALNELTARADSLARGDE